MVLDRCGRPRAALRHYEASRAALARQGDGHDRNLGLDVALRAARCLLELGEQYDEEEEGPLPDPPLEEGPLPEAPRDARPRGAQRRSRGVRAAASLLAARAPEATEGLRAALAAMGEVESEAADEARATLGALEEATTQFCYASLAPEYERTPLGS